MQSQNVYTNIGAECYFNLTSDITTQPQEDKTTNAIKKSSSNKSNSTNNKINTKNTPNDDYYLNKSLRYVPLEVISNLESNSDTNRAAGVKETNTINTNTSILEGRMELSVPPISNTSKRHSHVSLGKKMSQDSHQQNHIQQQQQPDSFYTNWDKVRTEALKNTLAQVNKPSQ